MTNNNLLLELELDNNLIDCGPWIRLVLILSYLLYKLIRSIYTAIPSNKIEAFTYQEIETIVNKNNKNIVAMSTVVTIDNLITDSDWDSDTYVEDDSETMFDSDNTSEYASIASDSDIFEMPDVDFDVCPIEELKLFEITSLYSNELIEHNISEEDIMEILSYFDKEDLATNWVNDVFLFIISLL